MRRIKLWLAGFIVVLATPAAAQGAVRNASTTYYCTPSECAYDAGTLAPPSGPTFNPTPPPTITAYTAGFSYDPAGGVLTYTEDTPDTTYPFDPNYCDDNAELPDCTQEAAQWTNLGQISLFHGIDTPGGESAAVSFGNAGASGVFPTAQADWSASGQEVVDPVVDSANIRLSEDGVRGSLAPVTTLSGNAITFAWSSSLLRNLNLTEIQTDTAGLFLDFDLHFAGYGARPPTPKPIKVPTGYTTPQYKPYRITTTGDGSGFYGGRTGHNIVPPSGRGTAKLGSLTWIAYNQSEGKATGVEWAKFGPGATAVESYRVDAKISIYVYRPRNGVFTRMQVTEVYNRNAFRIRGRHTFTFKFGAPWMIVGDLSARLWL